MFKHLKTYINKMSSLKNKECKEYNTLKYKTMIMTGQNIDTPIQNETNAEDLDSFLMNEMNENMGGWMRERKSE